MGLGLVIILPSLIRDLDKFYAGRTKTSVKNKHDREQHILRDHIPDYFLFHQVGCTLLSEVDAFVQLITLIEF